MYPALILPLADISHSSTDKLVSSNFQNGQVIYDDPFLYEAAFSYRDITLEANFFQDVFARHNNGATPHSLLDLGCGPGAHCIASALAGIPLVVGVDINPAMVAHARASAIHNGLGTGCIFEEGDIRTYQSRYAPFDVIVIALGTFMHLTEVVAGAACIVNASSLLSERGVLIVEMPHPGDMFDGSMINPESLGGERWESDDGLGTPTSNLEVQWGYKSDDFNPKSQVLTRTVKITAKGPEGRSVKEQVRHV
jgi:SAM-dependent methyltransferase